MSVSVLSRFYFFLFCRPSEQPDTPGSWRTDAAQGRRVPRRGRSLATLSWKIPFTVPSKQEPFYQKRFKEALGCSSARTLSCSSSFITETNPKKQFLSSQNRKRSLSLGVQSKINWWATDISKLQKIPRLVLAKESKFTLQHSGAAAGRQTAHDAIGRSTCQAEAEDLREK